MEEQPYQVIFKGEIAPNTTREEVKKNLAAFFKVDVKEIQQLFSGKPFVLKENLTREDAVQYIAQIEKTGARCKMIKITNNAEKTPDTNNEEPSPGEESISLHYETRYRLMFSGEIMAEKDINEVKTNLSIFYKVKPDRLSGLFTGKPVHIKEKTDFWTAAAYLNRFKECGAVAYFESEEPTETVQETAGKYKVVFSGELQEDQDLVTVKARLSSLFKVPGVVVDKLFLDKPVLVRTDLSQDAAESFKSNFEKTGGRCQVLEVSERPRVREPKVAELYPEEAVVEPAAPPAPPRQEPEIPVKSPPPKMTVEKQFAYGEPDQPRQPRQPRQPTLPRKKNNTVIILAVAAVIVVVFIIFNMLSKPASQEAEPVSTEQTAPATSRPQQPKAQPPPETSPAPVTKRGLLSDETEMFQDPNNYFFIYLPTGYKITNSSSEQESKITFQYYLNVNVSIVASPTQGEWDAGEALKQKVASIQEGKAGQLSDFQVEKFELVSFNDLEGYEILLKKEDQMIHLYALVSPNKNSFAISIVTAGSTAQENHDILDSAIRNELSYQ